MLPFKSVELFAGAGGLALGAEAAGFESILLVERNAPSCRTLRENRPDWNVLESDAREVDYSSFVGADLVSGGPSCQPFSLGGKGAAWNDERDCFPEAVRAVRKMRPKAFVFENVKGLLRPSFAPYLSYIVAQLNYPSIVRKEDEDWELHSERLARHGLREPAEYNVAYRLFQAACFGVPQKRERVFLWAFVGT